MTLSDLFNNFLQQSQSPMNEQVNGCCSGRIDKIQDPFRDEPSKLSSEGTPFPCKLIHQLDVIYYGEINRSYQREGFGILQSLEFDTYFGFWKNGRADGRGLLIYHEGMVIFGHFRRGELAGPVIYDEQTCLKICFIQGGQKTGLAYEYSKLSCKWTMIRYGRGSKALLKEELLPIAEGLPDMIKIEHSLWTFLTDYLSGQYFKQTKEKLGDKKKQKQPEQISKYTNLTQYLISADKDMICIGFKNKGCLHGLGCIYSKNRGQLFEAGLYNQGLLQGYGFASKRPQDYEINYFVEGNKEGLSYLHEPRTYTISEYQNNNRSKILQMTEQNFRKKQKSYNYEQKDFLSAPNTFIIRDVRAIIEEKERSVKNMKDETFGQKANDQEEKGNESTFRRSGSPTKSRADNADKKSLNLNEILRATTALVNSEQERTSLAIMRDKIYDYRIESSQVNARQMSNSRRQVLLNNKIMLDTLDFDQEEIAQEENPFDGAILGINLLLESPPKKFH